MVSRAAEAKTGRVRRQHRNVGLMVSRIPPRASSPMTIADDAPAALDYSPATRSATSRKWRHSQRTDGADIGCLQLAGLLASSHSPLATVREGSSAEDRSLRFKHWQLTGCRTYPGHFSANWSSDNSILRTTQSHVIAVAADFNREANLHFVHCPFVSNWRSRAD